MSATRRPRAAAARRPALVGVLAAMAALLLPAVWSAPAQAATYRYWTYWWGSGTGPAHTGWMFAPQGPASHGVADTWVLGWRFATSTTRSGTPPRALPGYADLCPGTSPQQGSVRVALVIDYGTAADAPPGEQPPTTTSVRRECLVLPASPRPTGVTALAAASVVVRADGNGLICGLDGYPRTECAPVIPDPAPTPTRTSTPAPTAGGGGAAAGRSPTASTRPASSPAGSRSPTTAASSPARSSTSSTARTTGTATPAATAAATAAVVPLTGGQPAPSATLPAVAGAPQGSAGSTSSAGPLGVVAGVVLVGGVGLAAWWSTRRPGGAP